jgi:molecular chaperone Hsp33
VEGNQAPSVAQKGVSDRIITATAAEGTVFIAAGITTDLVRETQERHQLGPIVSTIVGRLITGATLLGARLKDTERISLQIASEGPLRTVVADVVRTSPQGIGARAYSSIPDVELPVQTNGKSRIALAIGKGWLQVTRSYDVGQPYVGIVPLASGEIGDDIALYLLQSEQIPSVVTLGVMSTYENVVLSGGVIAQLLPGAAESAITMLNHHAHAMPPITQLIAEGATPEVLAQNFAGIYELRVLENYDVRFHCRCTREKVYLALMSLGRNELLKLITEQEKPEAVCEFCKMQYMLTREELQELIERLDHL